MQLHLGSGILLCMAMSVASTFFCLLGRNDDAAVICESLPPSLTIIGGLVYVANHLTHGSVRRYGAYPQQF